MIRPTFFYRIGHFAWRHKVPVIPWVMHRLCFLLCHADIPMSCSIGRNVEFGHFGLGTVLNDRVTIGDNVIIYQGVTIGRSRGIVDAGAATFEGIEIGANTLIGAHAIVLAKAPRMRIGANCEIGAGAVVIEDVPDNSIAVGNPARIRSRLGTC